MNKYEIMFIVKSNLEGDSLKKLVDDLQKIFKNSKSKINDFKDMGQKKFAYPIKKEVNGYYYLMNVDTNIETLDEFNRKVAINENIIRHLVIRLDEV